MLFLWIFASSCRSSEVQVRAVLQIPASCNARRRIRRNPDCMAMRCLIVDDNPPFLDAARVLLGREGVDVVAVASNSAEALRRVNELAPEVVLVDVVLGDESGFDLARRLESARSRVVLISTYDEADIEDLIAGSRAAGFLPKLELSARAIRRILAGPSPGVRT
jgi:DNA-binding NarL/FixJ family response regulator